MAGATEEMSDMATVAASPAGAEQRRHVRREAGWSARCADETGFAWEAWVVDHSAGGLGLDHCPRLEAGQVITVELKEIGAFPCRVAWSIDRRCGVEFLRAAGSFSPDDVEAIAHGLAKG